MKGRKEDKKKNEGLRREEIRKDKEGKKIGKIINGRIKTQED